MSEQPISPTVQLNTRGLRCPEPVMMLHQLSANLSLGMWLKSSQQIIRPRGIFLSFRMHLGR